MTDGNGTSGPPKTREELYERIRSTSKDEVILAEMIRLGFWPAGQGEPQGPAEHIRRIGETERELRALRTELSRLENLELMRIAVRERRMAAAREKRKETKERRELDRQQKANAWEQAKKKDIVYLGQGVSSALADRQTDLQRLGQYQLPVLESAADLAAAMNISVGELRFLAFSREVTRTTHYKRFYIPKKRGGQRLISAPMPRLKEAQHWIMENVLQPVTLHEAAHGFKTGRSIVTNAAPHTGKEVVVNIDLKDFFPTITYRRVKGLFCALGYPEQVAAILGLLCTEPETDEVTLDDKTYYVAQGARHLPQGAPSSPMLTNIICRRLDKRLLKLAETYGFAYTRYADDITFSGGKEAQEKIGKLLSKTRGIVEHEGFFVHPDKTRVLHKGRQQEVTGIVVNNKLSIKRKDLRRLRAVLFQIEKDGIQGKTWGGNPKGVMASLEGYGHFVSMVDKQKGTAILEKIQHLKGKYNYKKPVYKRYPKRVPSWKKRAEEAAAPVVEESVKKKKKPWWKFW